MSDRSPAAAGMIVDHTNVGAAFRRLSLPVALGMLGDQMLSIVDTIVIGSLGTVALAGATGATAIFITLLFALIGFASGISIVAAQRIGAGDLDGFAATVRSGIVFPLGAAAGIALAAAFFGEPLLHQMLGSLASIHAAAQYLTLRSISLLPMMVTIALATGIGAAGNKRLSVHVLLVVNTIHVPLVLILTRGWLTGHAFGIPGAALSSLVSEIAGAVFTVAYVARHTQYRIFASMRINWKLARQTAWLSLPEIVFLLAILAPDAFIVAMLAPLGAATVAAFRALNVVSDFTFVAPIPLQEATQTVIGQRLGAGDVPGARAFFSAARRYTVALTSVTGVIVALLAWPLAFVFTLNAAVASMAAVPLALHMITLPLKGYAMISMAPLRAAGDTRFSMFAGLICSVLVLPITWAGIKVMHLGLYAVPLAWVAAWLARSVITYVRIRRDDWTTRQPVAAAF